MTLLLCALKWLASFLTTPVLMILMTLIAVVLTVVLSSFFGMLEVGWAKLFPNPESRMAKLGRNLPAVTLFVIAFAAVTPKIMSGVFGCDTCLPAFMQTACKAEVVTQETRDRAEFDRLRAKYGW